MTNKEFYKEQILDIVCNGDRFAFNKDTNELCACGYSMSCRNCLFNDGTCGKMTKEWCNAEYVEPYPFKEGELVEVSDNGTIWCLRYFSHIGKNMEYKYYTYDTQKKIGDGTCWKYCRKYGTLGGLVKGSEKND